MRSQGNRIATIGPGSQDRRQPWTAEHLRALLARLFDGESIVVLANRQPFSHQRVAGGGIVVQRSSGGLVTALEPLLRACSGVWVAHGSGTADRAMVDRAVYDTVRAIGGEARFIRESGVRKPKTADEEEMTARDHLQLSLFRKSGEKPFSLDYVAENKRGSIKLFSDTAVKGRTEPNL